MIANAIPSGPRVHFIELEIEALNTATQIDVDHAEAILRSEIGNKVSNMTSKELKRDLLLFARNNPELFLELANDENIGIRNLGIKAVENNLIALSEDQRTRPHRRSYCRSTRPR